MTPGHSPGRAGLAWCCGFDRPGIPTYHAPAMASPLTQAATPAELADRIQVVEIKESFESFPRLVEIVERDISGLSVIGDAAKWRRFPVEIKLRFGWAGQGQAFVKGEVRTRMLARCQRCLEPFGYELGSTLNWLLVPPGDEPVDTTGFEPWELEGDRLKPADLVEESLIMAIPMAAMHADRQDCRLTVPDEPVQSANTVRPFATLKSQMQESK